MIKPENLIEQKEVTSDEILREEIREIKETEAEKQKRGEQFDLHFEDINPTDLTSDDLEIYRKFKEKTLTLKEFRQYQATFMHKGKEDSRSDFAAWLGNQFTTPEWLKFWGKEDEDDEDKE